MAETGNTKKKSWLKKALPILIILIILGGGAGYYIFTKGFDDTATIKADYTVSALPFLNEFRKDINTANKKYSEKIITVNGTVSEIEAADTTMNVKMTDAATGDYAIFAFQQQDMQAAKQVKTGDSISVKGSCNGGLFSSLLGVGSVTFKRSSINK